ncbi:hypothetical protein NQZ68_034983 [Dissostichus eleginoides]|nr:hypothetical protein NQZ68_034983 [Dissostichus eleginoides]
MSAVVVLRVGTDTMSNQQQRERGGNPGGGALVGPDCQQHPARSTGGRPGAGIPTLNGLGFHLGKQVVALDGAPIVPLD